MHPFLLTDRLVIATHNQGKLREFAAMLGGTIPTIVAAGDLGLPEPEETGDSFTANALLKARSAATLSGSAALADDSGLCVTALKGDPGIYSARWAGAHKDFAAAMRRVHEALGTANDRSACFVTVLALVTPHGEHVTVEGRIHGHIIWPPRGTGGHGYDPFFVPDGHSRTFAEMDDAEKNTLSHRGQALRKLLVAQ